MEKRIINSDTQNLAKNMFRRKQQNQSGYTLVLGAGASISSGCPSFYELCEQFCNEYSLTVENNDPITTAKTYIKTHSMNPIDYYTWFSDKLKIADPSIGYKHLANLIKQGYFSTIITTNYDCLLENALIKLMGLDDIKIMVRGEVDDDKIAESLRFNFPKVNIIKLHGDLTSGIFFINDDKTAKISNQLKTTLGNLLVKGCIIVGSDMKDIDLLRTLLDGQCESVLYVNTKDPTTDTSIMSILNSFTDKQTTTISGEAGKFDIFFSDLDMEVQKSYVFSSAIEKKHQSIEQSIIEKQEKGSGYVNYSNLTGLVNSYVNKIGREFKPDCLIFINDPSAPGGMELKRRLLNYFPNMKSDESIFTILIEGESGSRTHKRVVRSEQKDFNSIIENDFKKILVLDSITFSGNTMKMAIEQLREWFPYRDIRPGVLILDESLYQDITNDTQHSLSGIIYEKLTDRHEIFFPWGVTQATKECCRYFNGLDDNDYCIRVARKPWGSIEVLVDEKYCSVRILTIEADRAYSLQRHLCRDEFFISLDDNIGIEICCEKLSMEEFKKYPSYSDIPYIKSLVLEKGDYILIPRGLWHRFRASKERVRLLEIGYGVYDEDVDIERRLDPYGRENKSGKE
jgi:mannose-6-phosphate isomerase-like protein (cupin superfamily)/hypoxanthine phosphoribosyltransferase